MSRGIFSRAVTLALMALAQSGVCASADIVDTPPYDEKDRGPYNRFYFGGNIAWVSTSGGVGTALGYGADGAWLQRYDWQDGWAYAGLGAFYQGSNPSPGSFNAVGGQLLLRYRVSSFAILLGGAELNGVSNVDSTMRFAWGARYSLDYSIMRDQLTLGPAGSVLVFAPSDTTIMDYSAQLALKFWW
jgi:hypothetical protein